MNALRIDSEFKNLIPPLTKDEYRQLEKNLIEEGCRDSLVAWNSTIVDGHNRYEICTKNNIQFNVTEKEFKGRDNAKEWIILNQFGRRNISTLHRCELALALEGIVKARVKEKELIRKTTNPKSDESNLPKVNTNQELAKLAGVGHNIIHQVRVIKNEGAPEIQEQVRSGEKSINKAYKEIRKPKEIEPVEDKSNKLESNGKEMRKCSVCGVTKLASDFYYGKGNCRTCHSYMRNGEKVQGIEVDGDKILKEMTELNSVADKKYSNSIIPEIEGIVNSFLKDINPYSYKRLEFEQLTSSDKEEVKSILVKIETKINQIKNFVEV